MRKVYPDLENVIFTEYLKLKKEGEPELVTVLRNWIIDMFAVKKIEQAAHLIGISKAELPDYYQAQVRTRDNRVVTLDYSQSMSRAFSEAHSIYDPFVQLISNMTSWDESRSRQEIKNLVLNLASDFKYLFDVESSSAFRVFTLLYRNSRKNVKSRAVKQKAYCSIHECLSPFIPDLHSKEEFVKTRKQTALDNKTYSLHQRDSILRLLR